MTDNPNLTENKSADQTSNLVMVIGNGFDISLGLKSRYSDFMKSPYWPFKNRSGAEDCGLGAYLAKRHQIEKWMDVEEHMYRYCAKDNPVAYEHAGIMYSTAKSHSGNAPDLEEKKRALADLLSIDRQDYRALCDHFINYLNDNKLYDQLYDESPAKRLISALSDDIDLLFTFNYTNINRILRHLGLQPMDPDKVMYVHGSLNGCHNDSDSPSLGDSTAILGVDDQRQVLDDYMFMVKQYNPNFYRVNTNTKGRSLTKALGKAKHIVFFGLSFGDNDFSYFKPFFEKINKLDDHLESVTVFCYTDEDRMALLDRLAKVNSSTSVKYLQFNSDFQIITTKDDPDSKKVEEFIDSIEAKL